MPGGDLQERILTAALPHVPFDGWSVKALATGARDLGLAESEALRAFPGGPIDAIEFFIALADRRMVAAVEALGGEEKPVRERVSGAVRLRLEQNVAHREAIRAALAVLARPLHAGLAAKSLYRTVDAIWYVTGDRSTDFNFYTKRALLAAVYGATLLYWLNDRSEGHGETWAFLDRRIADAMRLPRIPALCAERFGLADPLHVLRRLRDRFGRAPPGARS
ncbi:MAG: COQ9 family protein [Alphaproteobacteria bacterium]|nr:COQ9 family protein [Alphaproteobacteria bacterium]